MKIIYAGSMFALLVAMNILALWARKRETPFTKELTFLIAGNTITITVSTLALVVPQEPAALFFQTLHYASTEWLLIILLIFMEQYTGKVEGNKITHVVTYIFSGVYSVILLSNVFFHHVVSCEYVQMKGETFRVFITKTPWYEIHRYFSFFLAFCCILTLLGASFRTTAFYRTKYNPAILALFATVIVEEICAVKKTFFDYASYGNIGLAIFLIYYSIFHVHKGLITTTLSLITTSSHSGVVCFDIDEKCIYANDVAKKLYPFVQELKDFEEIFRDWNQGRRFIDLEEQKWNKEFSINGRTLYFEVTFGKIRDKREDDIGCYFYFYDKTQDMENFKNERYRATHDTLTDLYNREYFNEQIQSILCGDENKKEMYYIIAADIKDFKLINDIFSFKFGNQILVEFAKQMKESLSEDAICGRMNSDRFAFCVMKEHFSEKRILSGIKKVAAMINSTQYQFHVHFGICQIAKEDENISIMYDRARMALRLIKDDYQESFSYYDEDMMKKMMREKHLVGEFDRALYEEQFEMYLQPQVLPDGTVLGAEALVRWNHPVEGMISPGEFISVFENSGLIHRLDYYMWEQAAKKLKEWKENGKSQYHISVNISTKDFYYLDIYESFTKLVEKYDVPPEKLKLEITESAFMKDSEKQLALIERLQNYGFQVEIDDFGSGYSSLNMLKDMKADVLKIDMGFLHETQEKERTRVILDMVVNLAKNLNMTVITEGVENKEQVDYLTTAGCDVFQGYYFERPIQVNEFEKRYFNVTVQP